MFHKQDDVKERVWGTVRGQEKAMQKLKMHNMTLSQLQRHHLLFPGSKQGQERESSYWQK